MSQEFCGVTGRKDSVVAPRLILSRKSLWNLFYQQLNRDTADLECFLLASQPSFHLAFLSCKFIYLTVFSPQSPSLFVSVDWGPGPHKAPAAWGRWQDCEHMWPFHPLKAGKSWGRVDVTSNIRCRKYSTPSTCLYFSQQFPKLCEGQELISSWSIFTGSDLSLISYLFLYPVQL